MSRHFRSVLLELLDTRQACKCPSFLPTFCLKVTLSSKLKDRPAVSPGCAWRLRVVSHWPSEAVAVVSHPWRQWLICGCVAGQFYVMMSPQDVLQAGQRTIAPRTGVAPRLVEQTRSSRDDRRRATHNEGWELKISEVMELGSFEFPVQWGCRSEAIVLSFFVLQLSDGAGIKSTVGLCSCPSWYLTVPWTQLKPAR